MIIHCYHRSYALALRHLTALRRKYGYAEIISRRRSDGRFSSRGTLYVKEVRPKEKKKKQIEIVLHFDYFSGSKKAGLKSIRFQVHVFGPANATDVEAIRAVRERSASGEWPQGWSHKAIYWGKPNQDNPEGVAPLRPDLRKSALAVGEATVIRRVEAKPGSARRNRKDKKKRGAH